MNSPAPTSKNAADDRRRRRAASRACSPPCSRANRTTRMTRRPTPGRRQACSGTALMAAAKSPDPVPMPRSKPQAGADLPARLGRRADPSQPAKPGRPPRPSVLSRSPKPQTADAGRYHQCPRLLGRRPTTPKQATPAQIAAITARQAVTSADPQSTASISAAFRRWPMRRLPTHRLTARTSSRPARRYRAAAGPHRPSQCRWPPPRSTRSSPRDRRVRDERDHDIDADRRCHRQRRSGCAS